MASKVPGVSCSLCGEVGHKPTTCWKELGVPPDGFFSGGGAHRDHGDGEEESVVHASKFYRVRVEWQTQNLMPLKDALSGKNLRA